jgi:hypothetical protein
MTRDRRGPHQVGAIIRCEGEMQRRRFLRLGAASGLWIGWPARAQGWFAPARPPQPADRLTAVFRQRTSAAAVGRAYLAGHPGEAGIDHLVIELGNALRRWDCEPDRADRITLRAAMSRLFKEDFARNRVVKVDGWVLSLSEARLCALAALVAA